LKKITEKIITVKLSHTAEISDFLYTD